MNRFKYLVIGAGAVAALVASGQAFPVAASEDGGKLFRTKCGVCHTIEKEKHRVGPSLFGVVGRKAGTAPGFGRYVGLKDADYSWDEAALDNYLQDPDKFVKSKGAKQSGMAFKLPKAEERKAVIEYLKTTK